VIPARLRRWLAFGAGVGIAIEGPRGAEALRAVAVRVRPTGARVMGELVIEEFRDKPAAEWGAEYAAWAGKLGVREAAAVVVLPRQEVILRQIALPGVSDQDLDAAVAFQLDGLHPYEEAAVVASWARLEGSAAVVVGIARRETVLRYATVFAEAGVKLAGFTSSGVAIHSGLRLFGKRPAAAVLAVAPLEGGVEVYGESPARALLSAALDLGPGETPERAVAVAAAELRFEETPEAVSFAELLGAEPARAFAAALISACPAHSLPFNLLPEDQREVRPAWRWIPTATLAVAVVLAALAVALFWRYWNGSYLERLNAEIAKVQPLAARASAIDQEIAKTRERTVLLDRLRERTKLDMDVLAAMTKLVAPPAWVQSMAVDGQQVSITGEADRAAPLLRAIDESALFEGSEFTSPPARGQGVETFSIRTRRSGDVP
jgi:Tfp pilus assembly protein PilN